MKKFILILLAILAMGTTQTVLAQMSGDDPVYIETISNDSKTINVILGLYPRTYEWDSDLSASQLKLRVLNQADKSFDWDNYKVYILLKDNTLMYNYTTQASSGEYDCTYIVDGGDLHTQTLCFKQKFSISDIKTVWVSFDSGKFFELFFYQK